MTMSLQIANPYFLDESFTTQMDLITGNIFYHSELGEYLKMLPPDIGDAIYKSIWKYRFSNKVLKIPHPLKIDYFGDDMSDASHSIIGERLSNLVERRREQCLNEIRRIEEGTYRAPPPFHQKHLQKAKERLDVAQTMTIQDVKDFQMGEPLSVSERVLGDSLYHELAGIKMNCMGKTNFPYARSGFRLVHDRCMCFNKDGKVCGASTYNHSVRVACPSYTHDRCNRHCNNERFQSLIGRLNIGGFDRSETATVVACCRKHEKSYQGVMSQKEMEDYCRSWGYTDEGHEGYWRKIDTRITSDTRNKKKVKEVKGELYKDVCVERLNRSQAMTTREQGRWMYCEDIHLPQMSKTAMKLWNPESSISFVSPSSRAQVERLGRAFNRLTHVDHGFEAGLLDDVMV